MHTRVRERPLPFVRPRSYARAAFVSAYPSSLLNVRGAYLARQGTHESACGAVLLSCGRRVPLAV